MFSDEDFTEYEKDSETGFLYAGARYYMAALGRFGVTDRFADKEPMLSPYQYGANNPALIVDVNGDSLVNPHGNVLGNEQVVRFLHRLNDEISQRLAEVRPDGYPNGSFTIRISGGDRNKDPDAGSDEGPVYSSTNGGVIHGSQPNSRHLERRGGIAVDVVIDRDLVSEEVMEEAGAAAGFEKVLKEGDHYHLAAPTSAATEFDKGSQRDPLSPLPFSSVSSFPSVNHRANAGSGSSENQLPQRSPASQTREIREAVGGLIRKLRLN